MTRLPYVMEKCPDQLWEGVECDLPAGHKGPHHRGPCSEGAALSWRSSAARPLRPSTPQLPTMFHLATFAR